MRTRTVVIRVDSSRQIGTGHVMRCLTLARQLQCEGTDIHFICRDLPGTIHHEIEIAGFPLHRLPNVQNTEQVVPDSEYSRWLGVSWEDDARQTKDIITQLGSDIHWLVVDHYALDERWEETLKDDVDFIMVIDDLANRPHACDLLLDQNLHASPTERYKPFLPETAVLLTGPRYGLLRAEFRSARKLVRKHDGVVRRILVFFGGADPGNETTKALNAIQSLPETDFSVDVVVGKANPHADDIARMCESLHDCTVYHGNANMAALMVQADISLGAGGTTTWERCCLGLPTLIIAVAENQIAISKEVSKRGMGYYLGTSAEVTVADIANAIAELCEHPSKIDTMSKAAMTMVDGNGAHRVVGEMLKKQKTGAVV